MGTMKRVDLNVVLVALHVPGTYDSCFNKEGVVDFSSPSAACLQYLLYTYAASLPQLEQVRQFPNGLFHCQSFPSRVSVSSLQARYNELGVQ